MAFVKRCCAVAFAILGLSVTGPLHAGNPSSTLLRHVNVVPMDEERVLRDQSVLIESGTIRAIAPDIVAPAGAHIIEARGKWLSPGLMDLHSHSTTAEDLKVYLANGVTAILNMGDATTDFIDNIRPAVNRGDIPGPRVFAGLRVDGTPEYGALVVASPAQAAAMDDIARTNGYDFIKVYNNLAPDTFLALIDGQKRGGLPVVGHGVARVGLMEQIRSGQVLVAHTEEFLYTVFGKQEPPTGPAPSVTLIPPVIAALKEHGTYVTADLNTFATISDQWGKPDVVRAYLRMPSSQYLTPQDRLGWQQGNYVGRKGVISQKVRFLATFTKMMVEAGVPMVAGTDAPAIPGLVPGFSLHDDFDRLKTAGLTNFQILSMATRVPGQFLHTYVPAAGQAGTVTVGTRADFVLSKGNPLVDLATLRNPVGVMVGGQWHDASALESMLQTVADEYRTVSYAPGQAKPASK
jgi:hypothetical protein